MIIPQDFKNILNAVSQGHSLFESLKLCSINAMEFFKYLEQHPEDDLDFKRARKIAAEVMLDESIGGIDAVDTEFELKKQTLKVRTNQWLAEKIIPETYGAKVEVNVNKTIDIRAVLADARSRVDAIETSAKEADPIQIGRLLGEGGVGGG